MFAHGFMYTSDLIFRNIVFIVSSDVQLDLYFYISILMILGESKKC